jgi:N4-gp56 family major capsid protein
LRHTKFAQEFTVPSKSGDIAKWRRYDEDEEAIVPLDEVTEPAATQMSKTDLLAQLSFYGAYKKISERVDLTVEDKVLAIATQLNGRQMARSIDILARNNLAACASRTVAAAHITASDLDNIVETLADNNAEMLTPIVPGTNKIGTSPISASYWGIISTKLIGDLKAVDGFIPVRNYPNPAEAQPGEWGATDNIRWLTTSIAYKDGGNYSCIILGANAYGTVKLAGAAETIVKSYQEAGGPLNLFMTCGWKVPFACRILNDSFMHILQVTRS